MQSDQVTKVNKAIVSSIGDTPLSILTLHQSKYYHLGTTNELIYYFCENDDLKTELNMDQVVNSLVTGDDEAIEGIVLNAVVAGGSVLPKNSIVEYSIIEKRVILGAKTILSNVHISSPCLSIPAGFLYHTIPIIHDSQTRYVTVAFHNTDDLKCEVDLVSSASLQYGGKLLDELYESSERYSTESVFSGSSSATLWTARIFTSHVDMNESFTETVTMLDNLLYQKKNVAHEDVTVY